jgi:hypothetical protein
VNTKVQGEMFPKGLLHSELFLGVVSSISADMIGVNLSEAGRPAGSHFAGGRYGRGEVGEFVLIEAQQSLLLARISEVRLREPDRKSIKKDFSGNNDLGALGQIQLLGSVAMDNLAVSAGIDVYPRLGDRIYAAPHKFISLLPMLMDLNSLEVDPILLNLGAISLENGGDVKIKPEKIFGRHCAILGATGGGKSWTTARIIEECIKHKSKIILIDATGEYRDFSGEMVQHCHLGDSISLAQGSIDSSLPPTSFLETDFLALFEPAGKVQGPKLRAAIKSLRLAELEPKLAPQGFIPKHNEVKAPVISAEVDPKNSPLLDDPRQPFNVLKLISQIEQECVWPTAFRTDPGKWGAMDEGSYANCLSLFSRISGVLTSPAFSFVFAPRARKPITQSIDEFLSGDKRLLRICLSGISYEFNAREIVANVIGRALLNRARNGAFHQQPTVIVVDEAHNFLGRRIGSEDYLAKLDAFELIAKEGRKYGLNICLASQRPRDITEGVLSQMGALIVHRLTNDRDREVVERACGEIDKAASAFLPNLRPGEATVIGADFPIPLTLRIHEPSTKPKSESPNYQKNWSLEK